MRGEQEEEESEDEISSHKTVVTKFLNKVQFQLAFYRKGSIFLRPTLFTILSLDYESTHTIFRRSKCKHDNCCPLCFYPKN